MVKRYEERGICEVHQCALQCVPLVYQAPYYICPGCKREEERENMVKREQIINQGKAIAELCPAKAAWLEARVISLFAVPFRDVMDEFEVKFGVAASADDLIWIVSQQLGCDLRRVVAAEFERGGVNYE